MRDTNMLLKKIKGKIIHKGIYKKMILLILFFVVIIYAFGCVYIYMSKYSESTLINIVPLEKFDFLKVSLKGASNPIDIGEKTTYDPVEEITTPVYRQLSSRPNFNYIKLSKQFIYITEDMGMSAYILDMLGNIIWERRVYNETYYDITPINNNEFVFSILNMEKLVKVNLANYSEEVIYKAPVRDIHKTKNGNVIFVENSIEGKVKIIDLEGNVIWVSEENFFWARGVFQKNNGNILVVDFKNKAYEIDFESNKVIWEMDGFKYPNSIIEMKNKNYLIADEHNNRIIEISPDNKKIVREYNDLFSPNYAIELENGDWLISDTDNHRVIQINKHNKIISEVSNLHAPNRATAINYE